MLESETYYLPLFLFVGTKKNVDALTRPSLILAKQKGKNVGI